MIKLIKYSEFKDFHINNNLDFIKPNFVEYCFGYYVENKIVGVCSYSNEYSLKNSIWDELNVQKPLTINDITSITNNFNVVDFINETIQYISENTDTSLITSLVSIKDSEKNKFYNNIGWYNFGYLSGNYTKKSSFFRYVKYIKNIDFYEENLSFLRYNYNENIAGIIYKITNIKNDKIYIGQTIRGFLVRYLEHKNAIRRGKNRDYPIYEAFKKYGFNYFKFEIIDHADTIEELNNKEINYISYYDSMNKGYNLNEGGNNSIPSKETRKKMSEARKGKKRTEEQKKRMSDAKKGKPTKPKTDEEKQYLSENSPKYWEGKKRDPETIKKVSQTKKLAGLKPPNTKKMVMVGSDGNLVKVYESAKDCSFDSGYSYDQIYDRLRGKYDNNLEHKFYYLDDYKGEYNLEKDLYIKPKGEEKDVFVYKIKNVVICDSNNEYIKTVSSVVEASEYTDVHHAAIRRRLKGEHKNQGDYYFHFEYDWDNKNFDRFVESDKNKPRSVVKYYINTGEIIEEYKSLNEASISNDIDVGIIKRKCEGKKSRQSLNNSKLEENISFKYFIC
jgi:group I intron endonuclease